MKLVVIESPYSGDVERNLRYVRACMADCLSRGEAPYASHALYTQEGVLDDTVPAERAQGIEAGFHWGDHASLRAVYTDLGTDSDGVKLGIDRAKYLGQPIEYRTLGPDWDAVAPTSDWLLVDIPNENTPEGP